MPWTGSVVGGDLRWKGWWEFIGVVGVSTVDIDGQCYYLDHQLLPCLPSYSLLSDVPRVVTLTSQCGQHFIPGAPTFTRGRRGKAIIRRPGDLFVVLGIGHLYITSLAIVQL